MFNSRVGKHVGKLKLRWMGPYIIKKEVAQGTLKLKNLNAFMNVRMVNGHVLKA